MMKRWTALFLIVLLSLSVVALAEDAAPFGLDRIRPDWSEKDVIALYGEPEPDTGWNSDCLQFVLHPSGLVDIMCEVWFDDDNDDIQGCVDTLEYRPYEFSSAGDEDWDAFNEFILEHMNSACGAASVYGTPSDLSEDLDGLHDAYVGWGGSETALYGWRVGNNGLAALFMDDCLYYFPNWF